MNVLAFALECAAVVALVGAAASLLVWPLLRAVGSSFAGAPAARADLAFLLGSLPSIAALTAVLAAAAPSLHALLTQGVDHCATHVHHLHLCIVHAAGLRPPIAAIGALFCAALVFRSLVSLGRWREERRLLSRLEAMGQTRLERFPVITVPGSPWLCLSTGVLRPRIIVSGTLGERLEPSELASALAHETAHLRRRDPLAHLLLGLSSLFSLPFVGRLAAGVFRQASEEASDLASAREVGDGAIVASALLKVAVHVRSAGAHAHHAAFGEHALERRVHRLLEAAPPGRTASWALIASLSFAAFALAAGLTFAGALHHAVETLLHHVS